MFIEGIYVDCIARRIKIRLNYRRFVSSKDLQEAASIMVFKAETFTDERFRRSLLQMAKILEYQNIKNLEKIM